MKIAIIVVTSTLVLMRVGEPDPACAAESPAPFASEPKGRLARTLRLNAPDLPAGIELSLTWKPWRVPSTVLISGTLRNVGARSLTIDAVPVLDATVQLREPPPGPFGRMTTYEPTDTWYETTYWTGGGWARVGRNWHHPGPRLPTVRAFQCPRDGDVTIRGRVFKLHRDGDGVIATVRHNLARLWSIRLRGDDGQGAEPNLRLSVKKGDMLRFVVASGPTITCDTTGWDPIVAYADGPTFRASDGFGHKQGKGGWYYEVQRADPDAQDFRPLAYKDSQWFGSTFWQGGHVWCRVGKNWHHPGEKLPSVRCFRCPASGQVTIAGRVFAMHKGGDGVKAFVRHNDHTVWKAEIDGSDEKGVEPKLSLAVCKGDAIRFIVDQNRSITCDTTGWDPTITYHDGTTFQASKGFSTKQGADGWSYEMFTGKMPDPPAPMAYGFGADLTQRERAITPATPVVLSHRDALPVAIVADGANRSGLTVVVDTAGPWSLRAAVTAEERPRLKLTVRLGAVTLQAGQVVKLPPFLLASHEGLWTAGVALLQQLVQAKRASPVPILAERVGAAYRRMTAAFDEPPELDLLLMAQAEWRRDDKVKDTIQSYTKVTAEHLERARKLAIERGRAQPDGFLRKETARLVQLAARAKRPGLPLSDWRALYTETRLLKRQIALANPLLDFEELLFCKRRLCRWSHLNMQYFGWRQRAGGGLFVLEHMGRSTRIRNVIGDRLPPGNVLEPRLSYDGRRVVFSYVECGDREMDPNKIVVNEEGLEEGYFHVYEINVDGTGLRQLTRGPYDDLMPDYLPDGGIVFCSTRRRSYSRCFGANYSHRWHAYTVHRMDADGGHPRTLSYNDVTEWFPTPSNTGHVLFARWDYIDRDAVTHENLWAMRPDGTNQTAVWGNATPKPHCMFQAKPVPNSSKIVFIASAHHALTGGPVCLVDPTVDSNSRLAAVTKVTPQPFPEAEGFNLPDYYEFAWPLSQRCFLVGYSHTYLRSQGQSYDDPTPDNALGVYLLDAAGNRELLYRDPALNSTTPIPLRPRPRPPVLPSHLPAKAPDTGELVLTDIYRGLGGVPRGTITEIRVVQIFPKVTPWANNPLIGFAGEENARAALGTVPVEPDGSARFRVPADTPILFQAIDKNGFAYQTMRSTTSLRPGEHTACIGCHEDRMTAPPGGMPIAMRRPPSEIARGPFDGKPFSYMKVVQPIWDRHCVGCHGDKDAKGKLVLTGTPQGRFARSYRSLCGDLKDFAGGKTNAENAAKAWVPRFGQRNRIEVTPPGGRYGALGSRLVKMLRAGHENVQLSDAEVRRIAMWIDLNAIFYGAYTPQRQAAQLAGKDIPMPEIQ